MPRDIVDPHIHIWSGDTHPWTKTMDKGANGIDLSKIRKPSPDYLPDNYLYDATASKKYNVLKTVNIEAAAPGDPVAETEWLQGIADNHPSGIPHAIIGHANLADPELEAVLKRHMAFKNFKGIRQMLDYHPLREDLRQTTRDDWMTDEQWLKGIKKLGEMDLLFDLQITVPQMMSTVEMVKKVPGTTFILNHNGFPFEHEENALFEWRAGIDALAQCSNVLVKLSGYGMTCADFENEKNMMKEFIQHTIKAFGPDRCMFASNFPVDKATMFYDDLVDTFDEALNDMGLSAEDKDKIFRTNAIKCYRL